MELILEVKKTHPVVDIIISTLWAIIAMQCVIILYGMGSTITFLDPHPSLISSVRGLRH